MKKSRFTESQIVKAIKENENGKSNNWHGHKHFIYLSKKENKNIQVDVKIIGPDIK